MTTISISSPGFVRGLCLAAAAVFALSAVPAQRAEAMSPINPGAAPQANSADLIQVRGGHGGGGGGHGFGGGHMGGGHFSGAHFGGGGWHGARVAHFGGYRYGGFRHYGGHRFAHFHHRRFYGGYGYYPYYYHHRCRIVWTYYGPRRVCWHRHWHRWHHWRHYW